jgi:hypothetical protein
MSVGNRIPSQHYLCKFYFNTSVMVFKFLMMKQLYQHSRFPPENISVTVYSLDV